MKEEFMFLTELFIVIVGSLVLMYVFHWLMKKWLRVERGFFSEKHVNEKHKKIESRIRVFFIISMLFVLVLNISLGEDEQMWTVEPLFIFALFIIVIEGFRARIEWRYTSNRNEALFTLCRLLFLLVIIGSLLLTSFWRFY
ncbi:DUF4181 domain-containing protein [Alkalihalobacillus pseudalcaliphilus]|uniref:DUF4181 domain-containing protein n=1 Tax=Alkalihalobacillus pseudalcaliphilus TaxID=79884 RepID=UPI00064D938C|nr:DUF4181 domain-containing protein [Alkalihalobacillus pseudalcaliphilus]KMK75157.1 hypothetical protein AB990_17080 [Alkalihalobacillus pseudalcaliphilus]